MLIEAGISEGSCENDARCSSDSFICSALNLVLRSKLDVVFGISSWARGGGDADSSRPCAIALSKSSPPLPFLQATKCEKKKKKVMRKKDITSGGGSGLSSQIFLSTCIRRRKAAIATRSRKEEIGGSE